MTRAKTTLMTQAKLDSYNTHEKMRLALQLLEAAQGELDSKLDLQALQQVDSRVEKATTMIANCMHTIWFAEQRAKKNEPKVMAFIKN